MPAKAHHPHSNPTTPLLINMPSPSATTTTSVAASVAASGDQPADEILFQLLPLIRVHKSGRVERLCGTNTVPASFDPATKVRSKDVVIDPKSDITARLYLPTTTTTTTTNDKLPIVVYFHGGAFFIESAFSPTYHPHLNALSSSGPLLAVSVNYRLAPENPLPAAYHDSWAALQWVFSQSDPWVSDRGDLGRLYVAGDSAGANIAQQMAARAAAEGGAGTIKGMALVHSFFWGKEPLGSEDRDPAGFRAVMERIWRFLCPGTEGLDDPRINPAAEAAAGLAALGCERVVVAVAGKDLLWSRGKLYYERLKGSGWRGEAQLVEAADGEHDFHLFSPQTEAAAALTKRLAAFFV